MKGGGRKTKVDASTALTGSRGKVMQGYSSWVIEFQGRHYAVPPNGLRIGRGQDNEIILPDDQVSRRHATVWIAQGNVYIRDEAPTWQSR